jgi:hypothetical protein
LRGEQITYACFWPGCEGEMAGRLMHPAGVDPFVRYFCPVCGCSSPASVIERMSPRRTITRQAHGGTLRLFFYNPAALRSERKSA